jgi:hypothetical protein
LGYSGRFYIHLFKDDVQRLEMERKNMNIQRKRAIATIALLIVLSLSAFAAILPSASAAVAIKQPYTTFAYLSATPSPIGVNQIALVTFRVDQPAFGALSLSGHFNGTSVTITRPDNKTETKTNLAMDATSSGWFQYTPTMTGTYYFQVHFPQNQYWINSSSTQTQYTYLADDSEMVPLVVQQDPIKYYTETPPLPTGYWTRPINAENFEWFTVADNWLMKDYDTTSRSFAGMPAYAPYSSGPQSAHILWSKPIIPGGKSGGPLGETDFYTGVSYEQHFEAMVVNGMLFYTEHGLGTTTTWGTRFINLYTGEDYPLMYMNTTNISFATIVDTNNPNEHGAIPYLVIQSGSNWLFYEIFPNMMKEPRLAFNLTGAGIAGTITHGPNGEILGFSTGGSGNTRWLAMFNSSRAVIGLSFGSGLETWSPSGTINASRGLNESPSGVSAANLAAYQAKTNSIYMGIEWNVTFPKPTVSTLTPSVRQFNYKEGWLLMTSYDTGPYPYVYYDVGFNIGQIGKLRSSDGTYPSAITPTFAANRTMIHDIHDRVGNNLASNKYIRYDEGEEVWYCFDMATGNQLWATTPIDNAWALFSRDYEIAYNKLITTAFDGYVRAYSMDDGSLLWTYYKGSSGFENAYGTYPEYAGFLVADHTVYTTADEHSSDGVLWRGSQLWAINTETGNLTWKINGMYRHPIVADGIVVALNSYDGQVYAFGRGPSATTVTAPQVVVSLGNKVMVTGTVTDQTPQFKDTPAISDASMGKWMEYMAMQKTIPGDAKGVDVMLIAIAPDGTTENIGTATSDLAGNYGIMWQPKQEGQYQIIATFAGSESYGSSFGTTYIGVGAAQAAPTVAPTTAAPTTAAPTTAAPTTAAPSTTAPEPGNNTMTYVYVGIAAVLIIVVILAAAITLRRRK